MNEMQILSEANELVRSGLRKAAIELLVEYLDSNPDSPVILKAIGRAYLLDKKPEKAVFYLQKSLQPSGVEKPGKMMGSHYRAESFDDGDMDFIGTENDQSDDESYQFDMETGVDQINTEKNDVKRNRKIISLNQAKKGEHQTDKTDRGVKLRYKTRKRMAPAKENTLGSPNETVITQNRPEPVPDGSTSEDSTSIILNVSDQKDNRSEQQRAESGTDQSERSIDDGLNQEIPDDVASQLGLLDGIDFDKIEVGTTIDLFEDFDDSDPSDDEHENDLDLLYQDEDEFPDELVWGDFEDVEEFDASARREVDETIETDGKISREQRASQIALEVLQNTHWDESNHALIEQIFIENGWSTAKTAVYRLINKGVEPEELRLARKIKQFWSGNEKYWTTFHRIKVNSFGKQAHDGYKQMSWLEAIRIIGCFNALPDIEEIYWLIDELFEEWYSNSRLRRSFKAFFKYLKYRTGSMNRTLPGDYFYSFYEMPENSIGGDSADLDFSFSSQYRELNDLGIVINHWPPPPKNIVLLTGEEE